MRRFLSALGLSLLFFTAVAVVPAAAADDLYKEVCRGKGSQSAVCKDNDGTKDPITGDDGLIMKITRIVSIIAGIAAVIIVIVSGLRYVMAGGDANQASSAKTTLIYALVGLLVIALAQAIIAVVIGAI